MESSAGPFSEHSEENPSRFVTRSKLGDFLCRALVHFISKLNVVRFHEQNKLGRNPPRWRVQSRSGRKPEEA